mmetsp:Transcript_28849/g.46863  ORF Transcript_28849/g.46863 Transcript_28849/m.46863 type:complete len:332 (-) Transcript_28849:260-1255(-)
MRSGLTSSKAKKDACEMIWKYMNKFIELDLKKKKKGCELNEFDAHRFLENFGMTLSVKDMREKLREIDIDFNKHVSLTEFLIYKHEADVHKLVNASQGEADMEKINKAQSLLEKAQADCEKSKEAAIKATEAAETAENSRLSAVKAENEAKKVEAELRKVQGEQTAAEDALKAEEKKLATKKENLKKKSKNMSLGVVKRNKAANMLQQLLAKDPLPLQKAKITQAAVVKKCQKATKKAARITGKAVEAREKAEADAKQAKAAKQASEDAVIAAETAIEKATEYLEKVKQEVKGAGKGKLWLMDRELEEAKKYMPKRALARLKKKMAEEKKN